MFILGFVPLDWSGSGLVIRDHSLTDHSTLKEPTNLQLGKDSSFHLGAVHSTQKFRKFQLVHYMERTISVSSDHNIWDQIWRWSTLTGLVFSVGQTNFPFPFDKIVVPSTALLYPAYKDNNQMGCGLGQACATRLCSSIGHLEFPKFQTGFFVEWKAPLMYQDPSDINHWPWSGQSQRNATLGKCLSPLSKGIHLTEMFVKKELSTDWISRSWRNRTMKMAAQLSQLN